VNESNQPIRRKLKLEVVRVMAGRRPGGLRERSQPGASGS